MAPRRTESRYRNDGRNFLEVREYGDDPRHGLDVAREILERDCPEGWHPHQIRIKKSSKGRRAHVDVVFRENLRPVAA